MDAQTQTRARRTTRKMKDDTAVLAAALIASPGSVETHHPFRASGPARLYCSFCWTALPSSVAECAECGRTLEEMAANRVSHADLAGSWVPPRMVEAAAAAATSAGGQNATRQPAARAALSDTSSRGAESKPGSPDAGRRFVARSGHPASRSAVPEWNAVAQRLESVSPRLAAGLIGGTLLIIVVVACVGLAQATGH